MEACLNFHTVLQRKWLCLHTLLVGKKFLLPLSHSLKIPVCSDISSIFLNNLIHIVLVPQLEIPKSWKTIPFLISKDLRRKYAERRTISSVLLSCLFSVKSSVNHHQYNIAEMFTTAEDYEFRGKCLSKILCLTLLCKFCLICTFSITLLCHRKAKECVRKIKINKRRQMRQPAMLFRGTCAIWICA